MRVMNIDEAFSRARANWNRAALDFIRAELEEKTGDVAMLNIAVMNLERELREAKKDREAALSVTRGQRMEITDLERELREARTALEEKP